LKDAPKWQATQQEVKLKTKKSKPPKPSQTTSNTKSAPQTNKNQPSSPQASGQADEETENVEQSCIGSGGRPEGQKASKRKRDKDVMLAKVLKTSEDLVRISQQRMESVRSAMQAADDDRTMSMDLTGMDEESQAYWKKKKRAILSRPEYST
jgi:hypothetical protein